MTSEILNLTSATTRLTASVLDDGNAEYTPAVSEVRSGTTTFSHSGLKSMAAQTDAGATPAVQATRTYDAFGGVQASTGTWQGPFGTAGAFGYQTEPSGLHLLGHRYYDASTGRFLTRDPIGDGSNWYAYCASSPVNTVDPSGLRWVYEQDDGGLYYDPPIRFVVPNMPFPSADHIKNHGPAPRGTYWLQPPRKRKSDGTPLPNIPMRPDPSNDMKGRDSFLIHPGSEAGDPSQGCVILVLPLMERIAGSGDREFLVVRNRQAVDKIRRRFW